MNLLLVTLFSLERNTSVAISNINITKGLLALGHKVTWVMPNWAQSETEFDFSQVRVIRVPGEDLPRNVGYIRGKLRSYFDMLDFASSYIREVRKVQIPNEYFDVVISTSDPKSSHIYSVWQKYKKLSPWRCMPEVLPKKLKLVAIIKRHVIWPFGIWLKKPQLIEG